MNKHLIITMICLLLYSLAVLGQAQRPEELTFQPLRYDPPNPADYRVECANGLRAYIQEDRSLPQFSISALVNFGELYVPQDKRGLGALMSETLVQGGTKIREGEAIEERINFLGGSLSFRVAERSAVLSLWVLSKDADEGLELFFDVLRNAEFREEPLNLARFRLIAQLRQANDEPRNVLQREYEKLLYGDHPLTWQPNRNTYQNVTSADLKAVHDKYFFPKNIILSASGDFDAAALKAKIDGFVVDWPNQDLSADEFAKEFPVPEPGVYFIQKDINQGYISLGHLGIEEIHPDYYAVQVMNFILGGGSFTSRITTKVRSDEGLSYNQGSRFATRWGFPGPFSGYVQTKSATVGYAISLIQEEFDRIRREPVTNKEMDTAINYYLESFPSAFESPQRTMATFAEMEMTGKPMDYYAKYRENFRAVTRERVLEVARKYIRPEQMIILIVGDWEPCNQGGDKWSGPLDKLGPVHHLTLADPMTGEVTKQ